ncbi:MAG: hypothetical protein WC242_00795 [Candidatus Paceibacterota bacterium]|jgi:hypothetical protein
MKNFSYNQKGYIALVGVILLGAAIVVALITISMGVGTGSKISIQLKNSEKSYFLANACAEDALEKLWESVSYSGNEILNFDQGICGILPVETGSDGKKTIKVYGSVADHTRRSVVIISTTTPQIIIESWKEVADF